MTVRLLDSLDLAEKRVLVRSDLNVGLDDQGRVEDDARIRAAARTIREVLDHGGQPVVMSHLGRPKGKADPKLSLRQLVDPLSEALGGVPVRFADDCIGERAASVIEKTMRSGERAVVLLENLRFHAGETENADDFADDLARLGDVYVDDAFSAAHRAHASIVGVAERLPSAAGRLMEDELRGLEEALRSRTPPYLAILGGAKVATKLGVVEAISGEADVIALGGALANTMLAAEGFEVGRSLRDPDKTRAAMEALDAARERDREIVLPSDAVVAPEASAPGDRRVVSISNVPPGWMILDVGPETAEQIAQHVRRARTIVWNGPLGAAETEAFGEATRRVAEAIVARTAEGETTSVVGGGDTVAVLARMNLLDGFSHVSLAGGAFLDWLQRKSLPGVKVLED